MSDWDSKYYKKHAKLQLQIALDALKDSPFSGEETILDIGCGDGKITKKLAERVPRGKVVGIDIAQNMIEEALSSYGDVSNLTFLQRDAEDFVFEEKFDLVTSFSALHWVKNHEKVFHNIRKCLKKKGKILFLILSEGDPKVAEVFEREPWKSRVADRFYKTSPEMYRELLKKFGFSEVDMRLIHCKSQFAGQTALIEHFMTWLPYGTGLPLKQAEQMAEELAENVQGEDRHPTLSDLLFYVTAHR